MKNFNFILTTAVQDGKSVMVNLAQVMFAIPIYFETSQPELIGTEFHFFDNRIVATRLPFEQLKLCTDYLEQPEKTSS